MTVHAECNESSVSSPESCPLWLIDTFPSDLQVVSGTTCSADNWMVNGTLSTPQDQPPDICMHGADQLNPSYNDKNWELFSIDSTGNPYYYLDYISGTTTTNYLSQMYDTASSTWYWIQFAVYPDHYNQSLAYCAITGYPNESIIECGQWFYQNPLNTSEYLPYSVTIDDHGCDFVSDDICVYDNGNDNILVSGVDISGDYSLWSDPSDYDGFKTTSGYTAWIRFMNNTWIIGYAQTLSDSVYAVCNADLAETQINPFDITTCNGYWALTNQSCCHSLVISNTDCNSKPTMAPTASPSLSPTVEPTIHPTNAPTASPIAAPSHSPSVTPTEGPSSIPTAVPSYGACFTNMFAMVGVTQHFQKLRETVQKYQFESF